MMDPVQLALLALIVFLIYCFCCMRKEDNRHPNSSFEHKKVPELHFPAGEIVAHGRVLRVQSQGATSSPFHDFVQRLVPKFEKQRKFEDDAGAYEFAVLFLSSEKTIEDMLKKMQFHTKKSFENKQFEAATLTNCEEPSFPKEDDELYNFITARPDGKDKHAEKIILDRFETLKTKYEEIGGKDCTHIVLYTWLPPCDWCAKKITSILKPHQDNGIHVHIIYSYLPKEWKDPDEDEAKRFKKATDTLKSAGMELKQETYDQYLIPSKKND